MLIMVYYATFFYFFREYILLTANWKKLEDIYAKWFFKVVEHNFASIIENKYV